MPTVELHPPGAVTVYDAPSGLAASVPPTVIGSAPQWSDDSDATYAELETSEHPDISWADYGEVAIPATPVATSAAHVHRVTARVRYQSLDVDMRPPRIRVIREEGGAEVSSLLGAEPTTAGSGATTWADLELGELSLGGLQEFLDVLNGDLSGNVRLQVHAPFLRVYEYRYPRTRVFEAYLIVKGRSDAPPCRIFPRGDGLGVGAGRNYPPAKSQQRSSRGVGYY